MKNVLILVGSARNGNSLFAAKQIEKQISEMEFIDSEIIQLSNYEIHCCDGCLECDSTSKCHYDDDVENLLEKVKKADGIVFISPTRWSLLSGDMKVFMDRLNPLAGKEILDNKKSFLIAIGQTNSEESDSISKALESLRFFSDDAGFEFIDSFAFENCLDSNDLSKTITSIDEFNEKIKNYLLKI